MTPLVLSADRVVAGRDLEVIEHGAVALEDGKIGWVGRAADATGVDHHLDGCTIVPGLIDGHVHLCSDSGPRLEMRADDAALTLRIASNLERFLKAGVTTVRDLGGAGTLTAKARDAVENGRLDGPRALTANRAITTTGGHGHQFGIECDDPASLRKAVRQVVKDGSDWVKVMASGGFIHFLRTEGAAPYFPLFTPEEFRVVIDEAHRYGLRVAAHAQNREAILAVFEAGIDTIEHMTFASGPQQAVVDEALVERIAEKGIPVSPTTNNWWLTVGVPWAPIDVALANLRRLYDLGIRFFAGTDVGIPTTTPEVYGEGLRVLFEIGIPGRDVLATATTTAADAIGLGSLTGALLPGLSADLVALEGDPLHDVEAYFRPRLVARQGRLTWLGPAPASRPHDSGGNEQ